MISPVTGEVLEKIKLNTESEALQLSGNQDYLYLLLSGSNSVSRVELETLSVSKLLTIEPQSHELLERSDSNLPTVLSIHSSPYRDDWVIARLSGRFASSSYVFQNGQLSDEGLAMITRGFVSFSSANNGITGWSQSQGLPISHNLFQFFTLNQNQITSLLHHYIPMETLDDAPLLTAQERIYSVGGTVADLTTMQVLDNQQCQTGFAGSSFSHYIDPANQHIYYMMDGYDDQIVLCAFDLQTMQQTGLTQIKVHEKERPVTIHSFGHYRDSLVTSNGLVGFLDKYGTLYLSALE